MVRSSTSGAPLMLAGRYRATQRIATGGMGTVYEAVDERLGRRVAVKILKEEYADDPMSVERFAREARAIAYLNHPHIVQILDSGDDAGRHYIVMELVQGPHLGQMLETEGRLAPQRAVQVAIQVCAAIGAAHAAGIVHRDIKPSNVLMHPDGRVVVTDFGIAQAQGQAALTGAGLVLGTAQYLSPEQASGHEAVPASDLYSLGILLFQMLTGSVPFTGQTPVAVALSHVTQQVPSVRSLVPDISPGLDRVVSIATASDPRQRYADAAEMETQLRAALTSPQPSPATMPLPVGEPPTERPARSSSRAAPRRHRWALAGGVALLVGLAGLAWITLSDDQTTPKDPTAAGDDTSAHTQRRQQAQDDGRSSSNGLRDTGRVVPTDAIGSDAKDLEGRLKDLGYDVHKAKLASADTKDAVIATVPAPGERLEEGQTIVLITSDGKPPEESSSSVVPADIVDTDVHEVEELLKESGLAVDKIEVDSDLAEDTVVDSYPAPGSTADAGTVILLVSRGP